MRVRVASDVSAVVDDKDLPRFLVNVALAWVIGKPAMRSLSFQL